MKFNTDSFESMALRAYFVASDENVHRVNTASTLVKAWADCACMAYAEGNVGNCLVSMQYLSNELARLSALTGEVCLMSDILDLTV